MSKKKVTLSIESKVYDEFKDYCENNAIMLSKKIEIFMKNIIKSKKGMFLLIFSFFFLINFTSALNFSDYNQTHFDLGTYNNTQYTSSLKLHTNNLTGNYTSRIFDAGSLANLNSIYFNKNQSIKEYFYSVDINSDVWRSNNSGVNWTLIKDDYNGATTNGATTLFINNNDTFYILFSQQVYRSTDLGFNWTRINDDYNGAEGQNSFVAIADKNNTLYIIEGDQEVWRSNNSGVNWTKVSTDINGGNGQVGGLVVDSFNRLIAIDSQADVWRSNNSGVNWTLIKDDYNGGAGNNINGLTIDSNDNLYALDDVAVYKSIDNGVNWNSTISDFNGALDLHNGVTIGIGLNNYIYTVDSNEDVFISTDNATNFTRQVSDFNSGNSNVVSINSFVRNTNLTLQVRNCSVSCTNEPFVGIDGTQNNYISNSSVLNLSGRYFQYKAYFNSQETAMSSELFNVTLNYSLLDSIPPLISISSPQNTSYNVKNISLNYTASDSSGINVCKYSLDGAANITLSSCTNTTLTSLSEGSHNVIVYANDTLGNLNSSSVVFSVDSLPPAISINSPQNITYGTSNIFVNFSTSDNSLVSSCRVYLDSILISSSCSTFTTSVSNGAHTLEVYANDTLGNLNSSSVVFNIDLTPPTYSDITTNTLAAYQNNNSHFNITWSDNNISSVLFESNFSGSARNYSMTSLGSGRYSYSGVIPAGTYYWKSYANDSLGNLNYTNNIEFTINKSEFGAKLYLNNNESDINITYEEILNASFVSADSGVQLYFDGLGISGGQNIILDAGVYNFTLVYNGNQNYSAKTITYFVYVDKATPDLELLLNGFSSDIGVGVFTIVNITAYSENPNLENVDLFENGVLISSGTILDEYINYTTPGAYIWKVNITESNNYYATELSRQIDVYDSNFPLYSNLKASPDHSATYQSMKKYYFNATWNDDIGINEVIFRFNGINYSYVNGDIERSGDEYYIELEDLAAGSYNYRWIANDSSSNTVSSPNDVLTVSKANAALIITVSPSSNIEYGELMSVSCIANNVETSEIVSLERNFVLISNPDNSILGAGVYNYGCDAGTTQNYSDPSAVSTQLNVAKTEPSTTLRLNNFSTDITLSHTGGLVEIASELNLLYGVSANISLYINGVYINSSINSLRYNHTFNSNSGSNEVTISYLGNENYTNYNLTRYVVVSSPPVTNNPSSGGGGGGGGAVGPKPQKSISLEFQSLGDVIISPGESKTLELSVRNTGETFLNKCKLKGEGEYSNWVRSDSVANINPGEITEYIFQITIPLNANKSLKSNLSLECVERNFGVPINVIILTYGLDIEITSLELMSEDELIMNYTVIGNSEFEENILIKVFDSFENILSTRERKIKVEAGKTFYSTKLDVSKAEKGLLRVEISKKGGAVIVDEFFVYDSKQPITGFAFFDRLSSSSFYSVFIIIFFVIVGLLIANRMRTVRKIKNIDQMHTKTEKKNIVKEVGEKPKEETKKVKFERLFEKKEREEADRQTTTKMKDEIKKDSFTFETYGKRKDLGFETY